MSFFPRRKTDQVYATLQQVQRRITAQAGEPSDTPLPPPPVARPMPAQSLLPFGRIGDDLPGSAPSEPSTTTAQPRTEPFRNTAAQRRNVLHVPIELAGFLLILWLGTVAIAYLVGQTKGQVHQAANPGSGFAAGPAGNRPVETPPTDTRSSRGNSILVLKKFPKSTPDLVRALEAEAQQLNAAINADLLAKGLKPWFAVRSPSNGGVQLFFGSANGQIGVNRQEWKLLVDMLVATPAYKSAHWLDISDGK